MTIKYIPFESRTGFKSPGFEVTPSGDIVAVSLNISQELDVQSLKVAGISIINNDDSSLSLGDSIINSSLQRVGTLNYLNVAGNVIFTNQDSSTTISVVDGTVTILSGPITGAIDNVDIGLLIPAAGAFTEVITNQITSGDTGSTSTLTITGSTIIEGNLSLDTLPTEIYHATRKDYVDNKISAFAIAFGA